MRRISLFFQEFGDVLLRRKSIGETRVFFGLQKRLANFSKTVLLRMISVYERLTGRLVSIQTRPMYASGYTKRIPNEFHSFPKCAIVLQGPLQLERDFTLETARLYRKMFPDATIVVSTWKGENADTLASLQAAGATVITSTPPQKRGGYNVNLQVFSARAGIEAAKKLGADYALKHRSDQRMYQDTVLEMMVHMLELFPPGKNARQNARLISGNGGPSYSPYWLGEIIFGQIDDVLDYYSPPLAGDKNEYHQFIPEVYLPSEFLKRKGWKLDWTAEQGLEVYRDCFIPLDWTMLDLYWYKYYRFESNHSRRYTIAHPPHALVDFGEWLGIYMHLENKIVRPEQRLVLKVARKEGEN